MMEGLGSPLPLWRRGRHLVVEDARLKVVLLSWSVWFNLKLCLEASPSVAEREAVSLGQGGRETQEKSPSMLGRLVAGRGGGSCITQGSLVKLIFFLTQIFINLNCVQKILLLCLGGGGLDVGEEAVSLKVVWLKRFPFLTQIVSRKFPFYGGQRGCWSWSRRKCDSR